MSKIINMSYVICFKVIHTDHQGVYEAQEALCCGERMNASGFELNIKNLEDKYAAVLNWKRKGLRVVVTGFISL